MPKKIGILLKTLSSENFKEDFLDGILYMNTLDFFRHYEEKIEGNVADKFEGVSAWLQPKDSNFSFALPNGETLKIRPEDVGSPTTINFNYHSGVNVFCMTHLHSHDIDMGIPLGDEEKGKLREYFTLPRDVEDLGSYLVVITDINAFLERALAAADKLVNEKSISYYETRQVSYYDEAGDSLILRNNIDGIFHKQSKFSHQSEYRLCIVRENPNNEYFKLSIGDIRDISYEMATSDFNNFIKIS